MTTKELQLLNLIDTDGQLSSLLTQGISYSQIALMIETLMNDGYITVTDDKLVLTQDGKEYLSSQSQKLNATDKKAWIHQQQQFYCTPISEEVIVFPTKI